MKRRLVSIGLACLIVLSMAGVAEAFGGNINPGSQSHPHGVPSAWTLSWSGVAPFSVVFQYDTLTPSWAWSISGTTTTSKMLSVVYDPCTTTTFANKLSVTDSDTPHSGGNWTSHAQEAGGLPC